MILYPFICSLEKSQKESSTKFQMLHTMSDALCKSVPQSHFVGSIEKKSSIRFVKFSFDGASDRGRWRTGRRLCCQHRAGVRWQGGLGGQVCLLRWKFHQGNQRHQRCRDTDPENQESGGDLQCQCLLVITFILFCNVPCECHYFSMFRRNAKQECTSKNAQECRRSPG